MQRVLQAALVVLSVTILAAVMWFYGQMPGVPSGSAGDPQADRRESRSGRMRPGMPPVRATVPASGAKPNPAVPGIAAAPGEESDLPADAIPHEHVLRFFNRADREAFLRMARELGADVLGEMDLNNAVRIRVPSEALLRKLLADGPRPVDRDRNYFVRPPDDPLLEKRRPEQDYTAMGDRLLQWLGIDGKNADLGRGVTVAVIDTEVGRHPALSEQRVLRVDDPALSAKGPLGAHGTAVASLIAGNGQGVAGVAPGTRILGIPAMSGDGIGDSFSLAQAIVKAVDMGADIINLSLAGRQPSRVLYDAVQHALANRVVIVAATGNDAVNAVSYPARYEGVIAVGATDAAGRHLYFSNSGDGVDVSAPGYGVNAAWAGEHEVLFSGTSAATPIVSAAIAAVLSRRPALSAAEAADIVLKTSVDTGYPGRDGNYGAGVVSLTGAMNAGKRGVYDVAVAPPFAQRAGETGAIARIYFYAQNRGTETIPSVLLHVSIDGAEEQLRFDKVAVGQTVSREYIIPPEEAQQPHQFHILHSAELVGATDAHPEDNSRQTLMTIGPAVPKP